MARATTTVVGLAIMLALVFGVATTAIGATGGNFILGKANGATSVSKLTASIAGPALTLVNQSTEAAATALNINVASGKAPLKVNAAAGTATNLSADELDGKDSSAFYAAGSKVADSSHADLADNATNAGNAYTVDGKHAADFAAAAHAHDERYYTETESDGRYLGKTQKAADSDKLDGKDSSAFAIRTEHNWAVAYECDTPDVWNECAPVTVTVPDGRTYYASVWSTFSAKHSEGFGAFQEVYYCSAGKGPGISTTNPCITPFGHSNMIELDERLSSASSSGESIPLSAGTYTFFTGIRPDDKALGIDYRGRVITKVMIRDATNGL